VSEYTDSFKEIFTDLIDCREEILALQEWLESEHPHETAKLADLKKRMPDLQNQLKEQVRKHGMGGEYLGYAFKVSKRSSLKADEAELLEKAMERGETTLLIEMGLLKYAVVPQQIERLDGEIKAVYGGFIERVEGTAAVTLPKSLKDL